jgi:hypothetical protein
LQEKKNYSIVPPLSATGNTEKSSSQDAQLMKVRTISVALTLTLMCATSAHAVPSMTIESPAKIAFNDMEMTPEENQAWQYLEIGRQATERFDWDTAIINFDRASSTFEDLCFSPYVQYLLEATKKAKAMKSEGYSLRDVSVTYRDTVNTYPNGCS